jgi:hypothetical protein|tara:strand:+ start:7979 stop:8209 length:231 start_codon:yes stop_codon:yes gene_type:complete
MQKLINVVALLSGLVSASLVGAAGYVYVNRVSIVESATEKVTAAATEAVAGAIPGMLGDSVPSLPAATGPAIPTLK